MFVFCLKEVAFSGPVGQALVFPVFWFSMDRKQPCFWSVYPRDFILSCSLTLDLLHQESVELDPAELG